jgi:hypothetical protein
MSAGIEQALFGAHDADRTRDLVLTKDVLYQLSYVGHHFTPSPVASIVFAPGRASSVWSGRWDLNPRQPAWKAGTLPLSYARPLSFHTLLHTIPISHLIKP